MHKLTYIVGIYFFIICCISVSLHGQEASITISYDKSIGLLSRALILKKGLALYDTITDTIPIVNGDFVYKKISAEPEYFQTRFYFSEGTYREIDFWVEEGNYKINFNSKLEPKIEIQSRSKFKNQYDKLKSEISNAEKELHDLLSKKNYKGRNIKELDKEIQTLKDSVNSAIDQNIYLRYINSYKSEPISLYALIQYAERPYEKQRVKNDPNKIIKLLDQLSIKINNLPSAFLLRNKLIITKQLDTSNFFLDVELPDTANKMIKISSLRGQYVLVDFWASWCIPCRDEFPNMIKSFRRYNNKGFNIIGISLDSNRQPWKEAIQSDQIGIWPQLIDLDGITRKRYAIRFIPESYLINPEGKIIAKNLRGNELDIKLMEIFKEK